MRTAGNHALSVVFVAVLAGAVAAAFFLQQQAQNRTDLLQPPGPVTWLSLSSTDPPKLTWRPPVNRDLAGFMLRVSDSAFPLTTDDGELYADICPDEHHIVLDLQQPLPARYYFSLFAYDTGWNGSEAAQIQIYCDLDGCIEEAIESLGDG